MPDLSAHWKGHIFQFGKVSPPAYDGASGLRLLVIFIVLEGVLGPRMALLGWLGLPVPPVWLRVPVMLALVLLSVRFFAGVKLSDFGLYGWSKWSRTEKSYFIQLVLIANLVFLFMFGKRMFYLLSQPGAGARIFGVFLPYLLWGFYQEVMYRGILQRELVRRWGAWAGILISNTLFTFGPLHFYHFTRTHWPLPIFASAFAIGLFFAVLFWRSGNLWMVGVLHGIGNVYMDGTQ